MADRLKDTLRLIPGYDPFATAGDCTFDEAAAQLALDFFSECLRHVKGERAGTALLLEPWQRAIIANAFGWKRPDGTRRYREVFVYVPRKNGKTTLLAGVINYVLFCDNEPGAEIYSAAADRDQARLVFAQAKGMVLQEPELDNRSQVYQNSIVVNETSSYKAISADANTKHGYNSHLVVVDELHAHRDGELVDVLTTSTGSRRQPMVVYITTADFARESICNEKLDYAEKVRDGVIADPAFLPVIYAADVDADWADPKVWARANPNLGVSLSEEYLQRECERAKQTPRFENTFKRLHLNIRTEQETRWFTMEMWDACDGTVAPAKGAVCYAGLDLSTRVDLSALVLDFPDGDDHLLMPFFFCPLDRMRERSKADKVPYDVWARQGHLVGTQGNVIDYKAIRAKLLELAGRYDIRQVGYDPWSATQFAQQLQDDDGFEVQEFRQGYRTMSEPSKEFEALILSKHIRHGGHPVLRWNAANVEVDTDPAGNIKPHKPKRGTGKDKRRIDGIVAAIMAVGLATAGGGKRQSIYETQDLMVI